jgi:hypothetical protein
VAYDIEGGMSAADISALNEALGVTASAAPAEAPVEQEAVPTAEPAETTPAPTAPPPPVAATAASPPKAEPTDIPVDKLKALLEARKRAVGAADPVLEKAASERAEAAKLRDEAQAARKELADAQALLDMARRNPLKFAKEILKTDPETYARDLYLSHKGTAPVEVVRQRETESVTEALRAEIAELRSRYEGDSQARERQQYIDQYTAKAREAVATHDKKASPWVARVYANNPDTVMQELVGMASQIAREHGEVIPPQELIPLLEDEMTKRFGKYDLGEAKPATPTINSKLASPSRRPPPAVDDEDDRDAALARTIAGLQAGEHLSE